MIAITESQCQQIAEAMRLGREHAISGLYATAPFDAALSLLAGLPKVPDVQGGTLFVRTDETRGLAMKDAKP